MSDLAGRRILVTGGAGVIGRELLAQLSGHGATVLSADREPLVGPPPAGVRHERMDLALDDLEPIWRFGPELIFHLAATFERSEESPEFWIPNWRDNVLLCHRLAEGARTAGGVDAIIFASSYLIYDPQLYLSAHPSADAVALAEDARQDPRNLCGAAKLYAEKEYEFARDQLNSSARVVMARIFRVYGRGSRDIVSRWVRMALAGDTLTVFQPENRFDYVYAGDVADGLLRLGTNNEASGVVNIGTGVARTVGEVLETLTAHLPDRTLSIAHEDRDGPYEASRAEIARLRELTGWTPPTDLATGVGRVIGWERGAR